MRTWGRVRWMKHLSGTFVLAMALFSCHQAGADDHQRAVPSPTGGPSVIRHLGLDLDRTHFGKVGGERPAPHTGGREPMPGRSAGPLTLDGADIYRLSCQSCHGPEGQGALPEILPLLGPASAMSAAAQQAHMRQIGHPISEAMARQLAAGARETVIARLRKGGQKMPAFGYLHADEQDALLAYLERLAGAPSPPPSRRVTMPAVRAGELLVRGTCHVCHDATGPGSHHEVMMGGVIPSLAAMRERPLGFFVRKVESGRAPGMGMMGAPSRMPAFPYLTVREMAAAYLYLHETPAAAFRAGARASGTMSGGRH